MKTLTTRTPKARTINRSLRACLVKHLSARLKQRLAALRPVRLGRSA